MHVLAAICCFHYFKIALSVLCTMFMRKTQLLSVFSFIVKHQTLCIWKVSPTSDATSQLQPQSTKLSCHLLCFFIVGVCLYLNVTCSKCLRKVSKNLNWLVYYHYCNTAILVFLAHSFTWSDCQDIFDIPVTPAYKLSSLASLLTPRSLSLSKTSQ